jgi:lipoate-protein ligase A
MAVDEALLLHAPRGGPTLRLYTWSLPTVSLGFRQGDPGWLDRCRAVGVDVVRRPSGGGAVLHGGDLTYAIVVPAGSSDVPGDLQGSYLWIRTVLLDGLRRAGLPVAPARSDTGADALPLCFSGSLGLEIELEGHKLVGSAQRRTPLAVLQHGSIRLGEPPDVRDALFGDSLPGPPPAAAACSRQAVARCLIQAFNDALGGRLSPMGLTEREEGTADSHEQVRRESPLWSPRLPQEGTSAAPIAMHSTAMTPLRAEPVGRFGRTRKLPGVLGHQT